MSRIPRPAALGIPSNPPSPVQSNNTFNKHLDPLSSPITLQSRYSNTSATSSISFYSQDGTTPAPTPQSSPRFETPPTIKRRPAPSIDSVVTSPNNSSPATSLRTTTTPVQYTRTVSSPGSLPNAKYRTATAPSSVKSSVGPLRSLQAGSPNDRAGSTKHPHVANAVPLSSGVGKSRAIVEMHFLKRNNAQVPPTNTDEGHHDRPLISLDSGHTIMVTRPEDVHAESRDRNHGARGTIGRDAPRTLDLDGTDTSCAYDGINEQTPSDSQPQAGSKQHEAHPDHISYRLELIDHLGEVLGMTSDEIKSKLDVGGLMHRVDAMHKRSSRLPEELDAISHQRTSVGSESSYSDLLQQLSEIADLTNWNGSTATLTDLEVASLKRESPALGLSLSGGAHGSSGGRSAAGESKIAHPSSDAGRKSMVFGVKLDVTPVGSWCTSLIGGQRHELPIVIFNIIEEIFKRGMCTAGLFRLSGDSERTAELYQAYNRPPFFGDNLDISIEPIANLTSIVKRYIRDLPYPILDESLFDVFGSFCSDASADPERASRTSTDTNGTGTERHVIAAQILIRLLPPLQFSLFVYLLAFLGQLQLYKENKLDIGGIAAIFGPGMCASRKKGIPGLGPAASSAQSSNMKDQAGETDKRSETKKLVDQSENILSWLLRKWPSISDNLLDPSYDEHFRKPDPYLGLEEAFSPVKRGQHADAPSSPGGSESDRRPRISRTDTAALRLPERALQKQKSMPALTDRRTVLGPTQVNSPVQQEQQIVQAKAVLLGGEGARYPSTSRQDINQPGLKNASRYGKKQSSAISATPAKSRPKRSLRSRSASFGSISSLKSLFKRGGNDSGLDDAGSVKLEERKCEPGCLGRRFDEVGSDGQMVYGGAVPAPKDDRVGVSLTRGLIAAHEPDPNASAVLGSLHDLLVSKDRQIAKDAQEIKRLREEIAAAKVDPSVVPSSEEPEHKETIDPRNRHGAPTRATETMGIPHDVQARLSALMSDLATAQLEVERKESACQKIQTKLVRVERDLEAARVSADSIGRHLVVAKTEVQVERGMRIKLEEERERERKKLEEVKGMLFSA